MAKYFLHKGMYAKQKSPPETGGDVFEGAVGLALPIVYL